MAPSSSHVILKEVEKHIFKHNLIFRHTCMYKQPTLTKQWNVAIFLQIWCSYFRHTGRLFLGCALRLVCCNIIRTSWETKKERLGYRKKYIEEFVWGTSFFLTARPSLFYVIFCCFLSLLSHFPKWRTCWMAPIKIHDNTRGWHTPASPFSSALKFSLCQYHLQSWTKYCGQIHKIK